MGNFDSCQLWPLLLGVRWLHVYARNTKTIVLLLLFLTPFFPYSRMIYSQRWKCCRYLENRVHWNVYCSGFYTVLTIQQKTEVFFYFIFSKVKKMHTHHWYKTILYYIHIHSHYTICPYLMYLEFWIENIYRLSWFGCILPTTHFTTQHYTFKHTEYTELYAQNV